MNEPSQSILKVENLEKNYGNFKAVSNISFAIMPGEIFGFLGVNGAGKTTTLRMLAGVLRPTNGRITIGDFDLDVQPLQAKQITGYIPDRPYIYSKLTGSEFLNFICQIYGLPQKVALERIERLLTEYRLIDARS